MADLDALNQILSKYDFTGEVPAKEFLDRLLFEGNSSYVDEFRSTFKDGFFTPVANKLKSLYVKLNRDIDNVNTKKIVDPFGISDISEEYKEKINAYKEKMAKLLDTDFTKDQKGFLNILSSSKTGDIVQQPSKKLMDDGEQKGFGIKKQTFDIGEDTKTFLGQNFEKFRKVDLKVTGANKQNFGEIGALVSELMGPLALLLAGVAATIGAFYVNGPAKGILEMIGKNGLRFSIKNIAKIIFKDISKVALKRIPLGIGTLFAFGFAIERFNNGDVVGGILEVVSGLVNLLDEVVPGLGFVLASGVDVLNAILDEQAGGSSAETSAKKLNILSGWQEKFIQTLKDVPMIGTLITIGSGFKNFFEGLTSGNTSQFMQGLDELESFPVLGYFPAMLRALLDSTTTDQEGKFNGINFSDVAKNLRKEVGKTVLKWIPDWFGMRKMFANIMGMDYNGEDVFIPDENDKINDQFNKNIAAFSKPVARGSISPADIAENDEQLKTLKLVRDKFQEESKDLLTSKMKFGTQEQIDAQEKLDNLNNQLTALFDRQREYKKSRYEHENDEYDKNGLIMRRNSQLQDQLSKNPSVENIRRQSVLDEAWKSTYYKNNQIADDYYKDKDTRNQEIQSLNTKIDIDSIPIGGIFNMQGSDGNLYTPEPNEALTLLPDDDTVLVDGISDLNKNMKVIFKSFSEQIAAMSNNGSNNFSSVNVSSGGGDSGSSRDRNFDFRQEYWGINPGLRH